MRETTHPTTAEVLLPPLGQFRNLDLQARLAQSVERQALNLMVVGSSPTVGDLLRQNSQLLLIDHSTLVKNGRLPFGGKVASHKLFPHGLLRKTFHNNCSSAICAFTST